MFDSQVSFSGNLLPTTLSTSIIQPVLLVFLTKLDPATIASTKRLKGLEKVTQGVIMTSDKICIHCRGTILSRSDSPNHCSISNLMTSNVMSSVSSFSLRVTPVLEAGHRQRAGSRDIRHFTHFLHLPHHICHSDSEAISLKSCLTFSESATPGWGKQSPQFLTSQSFYLLLLGILLLLIPIPTMSNPLPSTPGESSRSPSSVLNEAASSPHHRHSRSHEREQKWINPCRIPTVLPTFSSNSELIQTQPDEDIFHNIIVQATKAETQAVEFFKDFYREAFGGDPEESDRYERLTYDFLTDIMDQVNNELTDEHFSTLQVDETIRLMYQGLQKFAVGLEAIVLDQACYGGSFYHHFNEAEFQLKYVLCELQIAMLEKNISYNDITREIMKTEYRDLADKSTRYIRDWTIFRDYVKTLRYVRHAFQYFRNRAISSREVQNSVQDNN